IEGASRDRLVDTTYDERNLCCKITWTCYNPKMMSKQCHISRICSLFQLAIASTVIILIGAGAALFWQLHQGNLVRANISITRSNDVSVVGPPSLPAATVDAIFKTLGSPMLGTGKVVEQASRHAKID